MPVGEPYGIQNPLISNLDVGTFGIISSADRNITLVPNGTGVVDIVGTTQIDLAEAGYRCRIRNCDRAWQQAGLLGFGDGWANPFISIDDNSNKINTPFDVIGACIEINKRASTGYILGLNSLGTDPIIVCRMASILTTDKNAIIAGIELSITSANQPNAGSDAYPNAGVKASATNTGTPTVNHTVYGGHFISNTSGATGNFIRAIGIYASAIGNGGTRINYAGWFVGNVNVVTGNIYLQNNYALVLGTANDVTLSFDGTDFNINTGVIAPSDLVLNCGANKTLELAQTVWDDINFNAGQAQRPAASAPAVTTFLDNLGADTDIATVGFAVGEKLGFVTEYLHDCKENGSIYFHVHFQCDAAPTDTDYVQWQVDYTITADGETCAPTTPAVIEVPVDTQYEQVRANFPIISGIGLTIGDQIKIKLSRIASAGAAYAGVAKLCTFGVHVEKDTLGSRQVGVK